METLLAIIFIVFGVLQIILFFKIWGMTDDIREIKNKYINHRSSDSSSNQLFKERDAVIEIKTNRQMVVRKYDPKIEKYICYSDKGFFEGSFSESEIKRSAGLFKIGDLVTDIKTGKQMRIKEVTPEGLLSCYSGGGMHHDGDFKESDIKLFEN